MDERDVPISAPDFIFEEEPIETQYFKNTSIPAYLIRDIQYENGIFRYYHGFLYPVKGYPDPDALWVNDLIKKIVLEALKSAKIDIGLACFSKKKLEKLLRSFVVIASQAKRQQRYFLKYSFWSKGAKAIGKLIERVLIEIGIEKQLAGQAGKFACAIVQWDDAYLMRVMDMFSEMKAGTINELIRVIKIGEERELSTNVKGKYRLVVWILRMCKFIPKMRRAITKGLKNYKDIQFDDADKYHSCFWDTYNFGGKTYEERQGILKRLQGALPMQFEIRL